VGYFGRFVYSDGAWRDEPTAEAFLAVDIHDSDIATVDFRSRRRRGGSTSAFNRGTIGRTPTRVPRSTLTRRRPV
jgi:hypothetical protein